MGKRKKEKKRIAALKSRIYFYLAILAIILTGGTTITGIAYADLEVCKSSPTPDLFYNSSGPVGFFLNLNKN